MSSIGLVAIGGAGWMGGANYIRNLAAAIRAASPLTRITFIVGEPLAAEWRDVEPRVVVSSRGLVHRLLSGTRALRDHGADFLYPLTYDNDYNLGPSLLVLCLVFRTNIRPFLFWGNISRGLLNVKVGTA